LNETFDGKRITQTDEYCEDNSAIRQYILIEVVGNILLYAL